MLRHVSVNGMGSIGMTVDKNYGKRRDVSEYWEHLNSLHLKWSDDNGGRSDDDGEERHHWHSLQVVELS